MSANGELYINETCKDMFENDLDKFFGVCEWELDVSDFSDFWEMSNFPEKVTIDVLDKDEPEFKIGEATITSKPYVEDNGYGRTVEVEPKSIKIRKLEKPVRVE